MLSMMIVGLATFAIWSDVSGLQAQAPEWRAAGSSSSARGYIDVNSIRRNGERVTFTRELRLLEARPYGDGRTFNRIVEQYEANCAATTWRRLSLTGYLDQEFRDSLTEPDTDRPVAPNTTANVDFRAVCFNEWPR